MIKLKQTATRDNLTELTKVIYLLTNYSVVLSDDPENYFQTFQTSAKKYSRPVPSDDPYVSPLGVENVAADAVSRIQCSASSIKTYDLLTPCVTPV